MYYIMLYYINTVQYLVLHFIELIFSYIIFIATLLYKTFDYAIKIISYKNIFTIMKI